MLVTAVVIFVPVGLLVRGPLASFTDFDAASARPLVAQPCHRSTHAPVRYQRVIWIWMENHSYHQIIGNPAAPFENSLARACGLARHYRAIGHPSLPNYLAATGGSTFGVSTDHRAAMINAPTIFSEVAASGRQWRTYYESMPSNCHPGGRFPDARNPAALFTADRRLCGRWDVPMGTVRHGNLATALAQNRLPAFSLMIPNLCHSTHICPVASGDRWLSRWVDRIVTSPGYRDGSTALFLTWDEGKHEIGQHIPLVVVSPSTTPGTISKHLFNHYSLLRTTANLLGVTPPGQAATAASMRRAFGL